jgi:hypothetical protein
MTADGRRSPRVLLQLGVLIEEPPPECSASTAVVNRHGALILSPRPYPEESELRIRLLEREGTAPFRVVWVGEPDETGIHHLGVERLDEGPDFWGPEYAEAVLAEEKGRA